MRALVSGPVIAARPRGGGGGITYRPDRRSATGSAAVCRRRDARIDIGRAHQPLPDHPRGDRGGGRDRARAASSVCPAL